MTLGDHNRDKASADLLRRTLASSAATGAPGAETDACPDPEILAAYAERSLDAGETTRYELHFSQCTRCREELAAMARATAPAPRPARIRWIGTWGWVALAPVTAVLLITAIFIARRPAANRAAIEQPIVAMQTPSQPPVNAAIPEARAAEPAAPAPSEMKALDSTEQPGLAHIEKVPAESRIQSNAGSMQRTAPDFTAAVNAKNEGSAVSPAPADKTVSGSSVANLPLQSRNFSNVINAPAQAKAPRAPATQTPGGGVPYGAGNLRAQLQSPTSESPQPAVSAQHADVLDATVTVDQGLVPAAAPVPQSLADNSTGAPAEAAPKKARPLFMAGAAGGAAVNQMVVVEAPLDRAARTLVRSPDPHVLWRISNGRYVEMSADGGTTWRTQWTNATAHVVAGSAPSADTCWLVGRGGIVLLTTDANKWHAVTPPADGDFASVIAVDASSATITTTDGRSFQTSDGGKHWASAP
jgi:Photosynthesis system II assembly factor YCF48